MLIPPWGLVLKNRGCLRPDLICACKQHEMFAGKHLLYSGQSNHPNGERLRLISILTVSPGSFFYSFYCSFSLSCTLCLSFFYSVISPKMNRSIRDTFSECLSPAEEAMSPQYEVRVASAAHRLSWRMKMNLYALPFTNTQMMLDGLHPNSPNKCVCLAMLLCTFTVCQY